MRCFYGGMAAITGIVGLLFAVDGQWWLAGCSLVGALVTLGLDDVNEREARPPNG